MSRGRILPLLLFFAAVLGAFGQEAEPAPAAEQPIIGLFGRTLEQDVKTARFHELAAWCLELGLSDRGTRDELEKRILAHHGVKPAPPPEPADDKGQPSYSVVIDAAEKTEYSSPEGAQETYIRLSGGVVLTITDHRHDTKHLINADSVVFNQELNLFQATGNIEYRIKGKNKDDFFTGKHLIFNVKSLEGHFLEGTTFQKRSLKDEQLNFRFSGDFISRTPDDLIVMDDALITSSEAMPPNYHVRARKIWVLEGGDWGLQDAVLHVGRIPVLYFPFFFYPGDEVFFHPVFGYASREGTFVQTTTYFLGNKPAKTESLSVLQLTQSKTNDKEKELAGFFLRDTDRPLARKDWFVKAMLDLYSRLGAYGGLSGSLPGWGPWKTFDFSGGLALTRSLYKDYSLGQYTPYYQEADGSLSTYWNYADFRGFRIPLRYHGSLSLGTGGDYWSLKLLGELYSDPYVSFDFFNRKEDQDWVKYLTGPPQAPQDAATALLKDSLAVQVELAMTPQLPALKPWVEQLALTRMLAGVTFRSKDYDPARLSPERYTDPFRRFYYPESLILPDATLNLAGTLFSTAPASAAPKTPAPGAEGGPNLSPPWSAADKPAQVPGPESRGESYTPPSPPPPSAPAAVGAPLFASLGYSLVPRLTYESRTPAQLWLVPEDVDYHMAYSTLTSQNSASLGYELRLYETALQLKGALAATGNSRGISFYENSLPAQDRANLEQESYRLSNFNSTYSLTASSWPWASSATWKASSMRYNLQTLIYKRYFLAMDGSTPVYRDEFFTPTKSGFVAHDATLYLQADLPLATPSLKWYYVIPPLDETTNATASLLTGPLLSSVTVQAVKLDQAWLPRPTIVSETLKLGEAGEAKSVFTWDTEQSLPISWINSLRWSFLTATLTSRYAEEYAFQLPGGWMPTGRRSFLVREYSLLAKQSWLSEPFWKNRISWGGGFNLELVGDANRYTESSMVFGLSLLLNVHRFMDFKFETISRNPNVFQYLQPLADQTGRPWSNPLIDILKSMNFLSDRDRQEALFKLSSVSIEAVHYLDDWNLSIKYTGKPELETLATGAKEFRWNSLFTVFFQWKAISEIKTEIKQDKTGLSY